jgi:multidrug resistance efflux pump
MTWANRARMLFGMLVIIVTVAALTIVFSQRKGETTSTSAAIEAQSYPVGTDYAGSVVDQFVEQGDVVAAGDPIATIQSNTLKQDLGDGATIASSEVYDVHDDGTLTLKSTVAGTVDKLLVLQGGYAAAGSTVAEISASDPLFVSAEFVLDPKDFARVYQGAPVRLELPNSESIAGTVESFEVETVDGQAQAVVRVSSKKLVFGKSGGLIAPGTPIVAEMKLRNDDLLARGVDSVRDFVADLLAAFTK